MGPPYGGATRRRSSSRSRGSGTAPSSGSWPSPCPPARRSSRAVAALAREEGRGFSQDLLLHPEHPVLPVKPDQLGSFVGAQTFGPALIDVGLVQPVPQAGLGDPDVGGDLGGRAWPAPWPARSPRAETPEGGAVAFGLLSEEGVSPLRVGVRTTGATSCSSAAPSPA